MVVVALAGIVSSLVVYREGLIRRAAHHEAQIAAHGIRIPASPAPPPGTLVVKDPEVGTLTAYRMTSQAEWHARMSSEYSGSAARIGLLIVALLLISVLSPLGMAIRRKARLNAAVPAGRGPGRAGT